MTNATIVSDPVVECLKQEQCKEEFQDGQTTFKEEQIVSTDNLTKCSVQDVSVLPNNVPPIELSLRFRTNKNYENVERSCI